MREFYSAVNDIYKSYHEVSFDMLPNPAQQHLIGIYVKNQPISCKFDSINDTVTLNKLFDAFGDYYSGKLPIEDYNDRVGLLLETMIVEYEYELIADKYNEHVLFLDNIGELE